ncbi:MAG: YqaE/Pmp3 family membrane protein [Pleurocapsa sp.]
MKILQLLACIFVPPLGVFLISGISTALIINILLTILGIVPGIIHALWIFSKQSEQVNV